MTRDDWDDFLFNLAFWGKFIAVLAALWFVFA